MLLSNQELTSITGGAIKIGFFIALGSIISFMIGVVDGYLRPIKCNS